MMNWELAGILPSSELALYCRYADTDVRPANDLRLVWQASAIRLLPIYGPTQPSTGGTTMAKSLRFSHKILIAASLVVIAAFSLFTLYNDYLQRNAIRDDLQNYLREMGDVTANNIQNWLDGRILLVETVAQTFAS